MADPLTQFSQAMSTYSLTNDLAGLRREADRLRLATLDLEDENPASSFYRSSFERFEKKAAGQKKRAAEALREYERLQEREYKGHEAVLRRTEGKGDHPNILLPRGSSVQMIKKEDGTMELRKLAIDEYLSTYTNAQNVGTWSRWFQKSTGEKTSPYLLALAYQGTQEKLKDYVPAFTRYKRLYDEERSVIQKENAQRLEEFNRARQESLATAAKLFGYSGPTVTERPL